MIRLIRSAAAIVIVSTLVACGATTTPSPTLLPQLTVSLPIPTTDKAVIDAAMELMSTRLHSLGLGLFSSSAGANVTFEIPFDGTVDRAAIEAVLRTPGVVRLVGWTAADGATPLAGAKAPTGGEPIVDATQIAGASIVKPTEAGTTPGIEIALDPDGATAMAAWTAAHIGDSLVIVIDDTVLDSAVVLSAIPDGHVTLSFPNESTIRPEAIAAIMASGPFPARWINP